METTRKLAEFVYHNDFEDIPSDVIEKAKHCFLDWLGAALGGIREDASRLIIEYIQDTGGNHEASVIGTDIKTDRVHAAFGNGVIGHALDFDDYHSETVIHGTAACLPAILSVSESGGLGGADVLTALILGFDISIRLGLGLGSYHYERGWHSTSTAGIFGATAGVAKLLRLNPDEIVNAFGICGTQASGLRQVFGTMCKPFHPGKASMDAVISASLAKKGFTSSKKIIEGELGVLDVLTENSDDAMILDGLQSRYHILDVSFKPYPTCA